MQVRTTNHHGPFNNVIAHQVRRNKQQPMFTYQGWEAPQNIYYEMNPYLLQQAPSEQPRRLLISRNRNSIEGKDLSDRSSHRSLKVVRVNGLREVQKPKFLKHHDQLSLHSSKASKQSHPFGDRELQLQNENMILKEQQRVLRQKVRIFEEAKQQEIRSLQQKITSLIKYMEDVQTKMQKEQKQWSEKSQQLKNQGKYH